MLNKPHNLNPENISGPGQWFRLSIISGLLLVLVSAVILIVTFFFLVEADAELVFVGDVMFSRNVVRDLKKNNRLSVYPFERTVSFLRKADIAFCNLENPVSTGGTPIRKKYTFNADPVFAAAMKWAGFDIVSLANNHVLDYGETSLNETMKILADKGLRFVGLSYEDTPQEPVIIEAKGIKVGYLAYTDPETPYAYAREFLEFPLKPAKAEFDIMKRNIKALKEKADIIVVSMHWGIEFKPRSKRQEDIGRFLVDRGVDIVAGHHPHVQQDAEWYRNGLIIYSMGNFIFDLYQRPATLVSRLYRVRISKKGITKAEYLPLEIKKHHWQPTPAELKFVKVPRKQHL